MKSFINTIKNSKLLNIIYSILKIVVTIVLLLILFVIIVQRVTNNNFAIGGIRIFTIVSGSMVPEYTIGDILISENVTPDTIKIGDNITYLGEKQELKNLIITHKVEQVIKDGDEYHFITKGIANEVADPEINASQVYGKVIYKTIILSALCKIMNNNIAYFTIFAIVSILVSLQIVKAIYNKEDEENEGEEKK
jgi:signal peptidase